MTKQRIAKQKKDTVNKTDENASIVNKSDESASTVTLTEEITKSVKEKIDEPVDEKNVRKKKNTRWHFPNASQCPRCGSHDTVATSTKGNKQYRKCQRAICRWRYCVTGTKK